LCVFLELVTGERADEDVSKVVSECCYALRSLNKTHALPFLVFQTIDELIETGNSEQIFQKAIQEQGRGQVRAIPFNCEAKCFGHVDILLCVKK